MFILDTDTLTHLLHGHPQVVEWRSRVDEEVVLTAITRIEVLQGRFASVMKAADGEQLLLAHQRLAESERQLATFDILPIDEAAAAELERLMNAGSIDIIGGGGWVCVVLSSQQGGAHRRHQRQPPRAADDHRQPIRRRQLRVVSTTSGRLRGGPARPPPVYPKSVGGECIKVKGLRRLGRGDLLIASVTLANKATLITRNLKDFQKVPGWQIENWAD